MLPKRGRGLKPIGSWQFFSEAPLASYFANIDLRIIFDHNRRQNIQIAFKNVLIFREKDVPQSPNRHLLSYPGAPLTVTYP